MMIHSMLSKKIIEIQGLGNPSFLGGGFYAPFPMISKATSSGPPNNALLPCEGLIHRL